MSASVSKRDSAKKQISTILQWIKSANNKTQLQAAEQALINFEGFYSDFVRHHADVLSVTGSAEISYQNIEEEAGISLYESARSKLEKFIKSIQFQQPSTSDLNGTNNSEKTVGQPNPSNEVDNQQMKEIIAERSGLIIRRLANKAINSNAENTSATLASTLLETLTGHWATYSAAVFADWTVDLADDFDLVQDDYMSAKANLQDIINSLS